MENQFLGISLVIFTTGTIFCGFCLKQKQTIYANTMVIHKKLDFITQIDVSNSYEFNDIDELEYELTNTHPKKVKKKLFTRKNK